MSAQLDRILADGTITIAPWHDPIAADGIPTDSDDALITGRDAIFVPCECMLSGAR